MNPLAVLLVLLATQMTPCRARLQIRTQVYSTCALWYEQVKCWGFGACTEPSFIESERGALTTEPPPEPFYLGSGFVVDAITTGWGHSCAISTDKNLRCWGQGSWGPPIHGELGYGNTEYFSYYGNFGKNVDLGSDFVIESGESGGKHSCFLSTDHNIKCFGLNADGQLGLGDTEDRGDEPNEMGFYLNSVELGSDFVPMQIACGYRRSCSLSTANEVKCWGLNLRGALGLGDTASRGDDPSEMGDYLQTVDLGQHIPIRLVLGGSHSCALCLGNELICWGWNSDGQLGRSDGNAGSLKNIGDEPGEMGDHLIPVDLGSDFGAVNDLYLGVQHSCVASTSGKIKCFGRGDQGMLGYENGDYVGDDAGEMGDNLLYVDLGSAFNVTSFGGGGYSQSTCAVSTRNEVKCWGANGSGQLGIGHTENTGNEAGEMGDALPVLRLGFTASPTVSPSTSSPTMYPTTSPSMSPSTSSPTMFPITSLPTVSPTNCIKQGPCGDGYIDQTNGEYLTETTCDGYCVGGAFYTADCLCACVWNPYCGAATIAMPHFLCFVCSLAMALGMLGFE